MSFKKQARKQKLQKLLSLAITTVNTMNSLLPVAIPYAAMAQEVAKSTSYIQLQTTAAMVLDVGIQTADGLFFKTAEAFTNPVSNTTVQNEVVENGAQNVRQNGITISNTIGSGGGQYISQGGTALDTTVSSGGGQFIFQGGTALDTTVSSGGGQYISQGGTALDTQQLAGAAIVVRVSAGDTAVVTGTNTLGSFSLSNGVASNFLLENGGRQNISQGGTALDTTVSSGGLQNIYQGGTALDTTVSSGGGQYISQGGTALDTQQLAGAAVMVRVSAGDTKVVTGTNTLGSFSLSNGVASNFLLENGGWQVINQGGTALDTKVNSDGRQDIYQGGTALDTTLSSGGLQYISQGGTALDTTVSSDGRQYISQGGTALDTTVNSGGYQFISQGGTALDTTVNSGGYQFIYQGGTALDTTLSSGGLQYIYQGGTALDTQQLAGAAIGVIVIAGDTKVVTGTNTLGSFSLSNGVASNFLLENGGWQVINQGGTALDTTVNSDGYQNINQGGTALDTTINSGGYMWLDTGAQALGNTTNNGGILNLVNYDQTTLKLLGNNGTVWLNATDPSIAFSAGHNITLASLAGSQTFVINSDLANNLSDKITVSGNATGTHYISIGREASAVDAILALNGHSSTVASINSGDAIFKPSQSTIEGVNILPKLTQSGNDWLLTGYMLAGPSKLALTADAAGHMLYTAVLATDNNMQRRMGELRDNANNSGIWLRTYGGEYSMDNSTLKHFTIQGGYDWVKPTANGKVVTGITLEHQNGSSDYLEGSGKLTNTRVGMYHAWLGNSGHYYDIVAKTGRLGNKFTAYDSGTAINASYKAWNTTLSAEYGYTKQLRQGYYIRPQAELIYSRINGANYAADNGTAISQAGINSLVARLGASIGRNLDHVNYYLTASMLHEFVAKDNITIGSGNYASSFEHSFKGTSLELTLGGNIKTGKNGNLYVETARSFGGKVVNKWKGQIGYRYGF